MEALLEKVQNLREKYVHENPGTSEDDECDYIKAKCEQLIRSELSAIYGANFEASKSEVLYRAGQLLNQSNRYEPLAAKLLEKSLKLDPTQSQAWFELGSAESKNGDIEYAVVCFEKSLQLQKSADAMASLAIALRASASKSDNVGVRKTLREKALQLAKSAVELDGSLGLAHSALATGYLVEFFSTAQSNMETLADACNSYKNALECGDQKRNAELFANFATALRYQEDFVGAVEQMRNARRHDPRDAIDSSRRLRALCEYLEKFADAVEKKGKLKAKRLVSMIDSLPASSSHATELHVKVLATVNHEEIVPLTLAVCDSTGECFGMTVYNCSATFGFVIGDTLSLHDPDWHVLTDFHIGNRHVEKLRWCRVLSPRHLRRNGVPVASSALAPATLRIIRN
ncbi:unnamed protein product [Caenorhabditis bovis]|uniref:Tetratricopeptide repeat protein 5 OB fold domain-containing protein n=1 Tax=Caenorhabditis bovis TaxID=2654633 RepID=A0A8S1F787_9PELO|nr:unnamed protein product [Caenorhabditis bovis]